MSTQLGGGGHRLGPAYERRRGAEVRDPVGPAVRGHQVPAGQRLDRLAGREPGRERDDAAHVRVVGDRRAGPRTHRVAEDDDRQRAVGGPHLVERPSRVGDR